MKRNQFDWLYTAVALTMFACLGAMLAWRG